MSNDSGRVPSEPGSQGSAPSPDGLGHSASIPSAGCAGKRHYPTKARAARGIKAIIREGRGGHSDSKHDQRGHLRPYLCDCGLWCVARGYEGRPESKRQPELSREDFGRGAAVFKQASDIAAIRYPLGANATQLANILREVLAASAIEARSGETAQQARSGTDESAVPQADAHDQ